MTVYGSILGSKARRYDLNRCLPNGAFTQAVKRGVSPSLNMNRIVYVRPPYASNKSHEITAIEKFTALSNRISLLLKYSALCARFSISRSVETNIVDCLRNFPWINWFSSIMCNKMLTKYVNINLCDFGKYNYDGTTYTRTYIYLCPRKHVINMYTKCFIPQSPRNKMLTTKFN